MAVHFVGFRDDRYWNAVAIWGMPDFFHRYWDTRAVQEAVDGDTVVFAKGTGSAVSPYSFDDSSVF